jgi:hypothetical protein
MRVLTQATLALALLLSTTLLSRAALCQALPKDPSEQKKKLPSSGLLAVSSISGATSTTTGDIFGDEDMFGKALPPLTGSVSRKSEEMWSFRVTNNSEDKNSDNLDLIQKNEDGTTVKFGSYSYTLKAGQSDGQDVTSGLNASKGELYLRNYRVYPKNKPTTGEVK